MNSYINNGNNQNNENDYFNIKDDQILQAAIPLQQPITPQNPAIQTAGQQNLNNIRELGTSNSPQPNDNIFTMTIIGQIEGHQLLPAQSKSTKYEHVIPQLVSAEQNPRVEGVLLILNTSGGDVEAGLAISELISSISKPTVSLVLGGGHSIGIPIAVSCDYSFISPTGTMTVHPIRYTGLVINGHQQFEYLQKMQDRVIDFVCKHSKVSENEIRNLMFKTGELAQDIGTILVGKEAVDVGLIDDVGGLHEVFATLNRMINERKALN